jgi:DNA-binding Xre family transcriptional regulator
MKKFDDYLKTRLSDKEIKDINLQAQREYRCLKNLQKQISNELDEYMKTENIGFNELARRLDLSATQLSKIQKGQANITIATLSQIFAIIEKQPHLNFITLKN